MWPGLGESPGEKGIGEERKADSRHIYKVELTGLKEGFVIDEGPVRRNQE